MEDARWTLPLFLCVGWSDVLGQGRRTGSGPLCAVHRQAPEGQLSHACLRDWLDRVGAGGRLGVERRASYRPRRFSEFAGSLQSMGGRRSA